MNLDLPIAMPAARAADDPDSPSGWVASPETAFPAWMRKAAVPCSEKSILVYSSMWNKFIAWTGSRRIELSSCTSSDVSSFLSSIHVSSLHEQRYLRILASVWEHLAEIGVPVVENVGKREKRNKAHKGEGITPHATSFLSDADIKRLERKLQEIFERPLPPAGSEDKREEWIEIRDAAMIGVMMGAGLKLGEVLAWCYSVNRTELPGLGLGVPVLNMPDNVSAENPLLDVGAWLALPRFGVVGARTVPNFPIGQAALRAWQRCRDHYGFDGPGYRWREYRIIFPADIARRRADQERRRGDVELRSSQLDARNAWRRINGLLERAGIPGKLATTQALRNTYVARLLQAGYSDASIKDYLGLLLEGSATRIRVAQEGAAALRH